MSELIIDPQHANQHAKSRKCEDAILVVGQIDTCLDKEKDKCDDTWDRKWLVKKLIGILLAVWIVIVTESFLQVLHYET